MSELLDNPNLYKSNTEGKPEAEKERLLVDALLSSSFIDAIVEAFLSDTPVLKNITVPNKNTKTSLVLEEGCKQLIIKTKSAVTTIAYAFSESDYDAGITHTIECGQYYKVNGLTLSGKTLYFSTNDDNRIIEVQQWT